MRFYAALGNHGSRTNRFYKPWNMNGERYYTYSKKNARFFVLDTDYMGPKQLEWIEKALRKGYMDESLRHDVGVASDLLPASLLSHPYAREAEMFGSSGIRHLSAPDYGLAASDDHDVAVDPNVLYLAV